MKNDTNTLLWLGAGALALYLFWQNKTVMSAVAVTPPGALPAPMLPVSRNVIEPGILSQNTAILQHDIPSQNVAIVDHGIPSQNVAIVDHGIPSQNVAMLDPASQKVAITPAASQEFEIAPGYAPFVRVDDGLYKEFQNNDFPGAMSGYYTDFSEI